MLTSFPKFPTAKFAPLPAAGGGNLGTPPALGRLLPAFQSPLSRSAAAEGLGLHSCYIFPRHRESPRGPAEDRLPEKMWKVPVLLLVLGRTLLWVPAEGAVTVRPEDDITTLKMEDGMVTPGVEDNPVTPGASKEPYESAGLTAQVPTNTKRADIPIEDMSTPGSTVPGQEGSQSTTTLHAATSHSVEGTQTTVERDGLATGTLVGIIVGVLLAIGFIGGLIIVVVRKMSGRP
ncbi:podoplanin isoform X2 [Pteronotus mesoamericanus]|uniref:podoplanin isoform X2 n=1 Tax=Pteronotus mesoamericanus TaxID=1884717 RepID=UPI0023EBA70D|nr:podoplanin isoform X2 [Pteronotus parnellii mesoamericanus]